VVATYVPPGAGSRLMIRVASWREGRLTFERQLDRAFHLEGIRIVRVGGEGPGGTGPIGPSERCLRSRWSDWGG
jgi:hypothetical protein